jgi:hypothetical protein
MEKGTFSTSKYEDDRKCLKIFGGVFWGSEGHSDAPSRAMAPHHSKRAWIYPVILSNLNKMHKF